MVGPSIEEVTAQLACALPSIGDPDYVSQLLCLKPFDLALWYNHHEPFSQAPLPAIPADGNLSYPYISAGERRSFIDTSGTRTSAWDTRCAWTFTFENAQLWLDASEVVNLPFKFTVEIQATMEVAMRDPSTVSEEMKAWYGLSQDDLDDSLFNLYIAQIVPISITNSLEGRNAEAVNAAIKAFLPRDEAAVFCPCIFQDTLEQADGGGGTDQKVAIAMGSPYGEGNWNRVYIVKASSTSLANPSASPAWIQPWSFLTADLNSTIVISSWAVQMPIIAQLEPWRTVSYMNNIVQSWTPSSSGVTVPPSSDSSIGWVPYTDKGFLWKAKQQIPDEDTDAIAPFAATTADLSDTNVQMADSVMTVRTLDRRVDSRMYFTPGYTDSNGIDIGPRLPMQVYKYLPPLPPPTQPPTSPDPPPPPKTPPPPPPTTGPKWQLALVGKNTMSWKIGYEDDNPFPTGGGGAGTSANGVWEVWWMTFFSFREFVGQQATFTASTVATEANGITGTAPPDNPDFLTETITDETNAYKTWLQNTQFADQMSQSIKSNININVPVATQVSSGPGYFNNVGDLIVNFTYT